MERGRPERLMCSWCGTPFAVPARGRLPKWCSGQCRHRAWEQDRAAKSGRSAVEVVVREIVVKEAVRRIPRSAEWADTLLTLTQQLNEFKVYRRDLPAIRLALERVSRALERRDW